MTGLDTPARVAMIHYDVPNTDGSAIHITLSEEEAIKLQKLSVLNKNFSYKSDQEALEDFLTIHWAWRIYE